MWSLVAFCGLIMIALGIIAVVRPMPSLKLPTRGRGALAAFIGLILLTTGAVQDQAGKTTAPVRALSSGAPDDAPQTDVAARRELSSTATTAPSAPVRTAPQWTQVANWSGSGMKETESFAVANREWRVRWKSGNEPLANAGLLQLYVYNQDGQLVSLAANQQGAGEDVSYVRAPPGRYYIKINSANIDWDISVEDQR